MMKTIGLLGGMSWESTLEYYRLINEETKHRRGGLHSARCLLYSVDFGEIEPFMQVDEWDQISQILVKASRILEAGGADFLLLCTNTMHKLYETIQEALTIELIHIADPTAEEILKAGINKIGLLGTKPTMEQDFYRERLQEKGIDVIIPGEQDRDVVHRVIFKELCLGKYDMRSQQEYIRIMNDLTAQGAEGIVLGCTEITLLLKKEEVSVPVFDTTSLHAVKAVERALEDEIPGE